MILLLFSDAPSLCFVQLKGVKVYCYSSKSGDDDRRFELFYTSDTGDVEQYVIQCKNEYSKDAWIRDVTDAMLQAGMCYLFLIMYF